MDVEFVVETGSVWSTHHFACLIGFGPNGVHPNIALTTIFLIVS